MYQFLNGLMSNFSELKSGVIMTTAECRQLSPLEAGEDNSKLEPSQNWKKIQIQSNKRTCYRDLRHAETGLYFEKNPEHMPVSAGFP